MAEHTKGPWRAGFQSELDRRHEMIVRAEEVDGQPWVAPCRSNFGGIEIEANARLIAAAPEMLAALVETEELFAFFEGSEERAHDGPTAELVIKINTGDVARVMGSIRAARAKALGQGPTV